jgi:ubiquinone/menaquinone biosynthesis C-methylase UbiE
VTEEDVRADEELKRRAFRFYGTEDEKRWGRDRQPEGEKEIVRWIDRTTGRRKAVVVELGAGRGAFAGFASRFAYLGVDISFEALRRYLGGAGSIQADIENLPVTSNAADFVFTIATLEHVPHPEKVLGEIHRVLKPGGTAFLAPAWFCRPWAAKGLPVKRYRELGFGDQVRKAMIPLRNSVAWRAALVLPRRLAREIQFVFASKRWAFHYKRLKPNLDEYVYTDCDAFCSLDPHEAALLFRSWNYLVRSAPTFWQRLILRHVPVVVTKPREAPSEELDRI